MSAVLDSPLPAIQPDLIPSRTEVAVAAGTAVDLLSIKIEDVALARFGDWRKAIAEAKVQHATIAWDLSTAKGMKDIKSFRQRECADHQADTNKVADALVTKLTAVSKLVRTEQAEKVTAYKELAAPLTLLIDARQAEIDAEEIRKAEEAKKAEDARKVGQQALLDGFDRWIERCQTEGMTPERIGLGIVALTDTPIGPEFDADYRSAAEARKLLTLARMLNIRGELTAAIQADAQRQLDEQAAELARQQAEIKAREEAAALAIQQEIEAAQARAAAQAAAEAASHAAGPAAGEVENPGTCAEATQVQRSETAVSQIAGQHSQESACSTQAGRQRDDAHGGAETRGASPAEDCEDLSGVATGPLHPFTPNTQEGLCPADAPACTSSEAEAAEASPSGDEGTGAHADDSAPEPDLSTFFTTDQQPAQAPRLDYEGLGLPPPDPLDGLPNSLRDVDAPLSSSFDGPADDEVLYVDGGCAPPVAAPRVILAGPEEDDNEGGIDATELRHRAMELVTLVRKAKSSKVSMSHQWWADLLAAAEALADAFGEGA
jgi:hypothetical protein